MSGQGRPVALDTPHVVVVTRLEVPALGEPVEGRDQHPSTQGQLFLGPGAPPPRLQSWACVPVVAPLTYNQMVVHELDDDVMDRIFQALADKTRRDIVTRVIEEEQSVS